MFFFSSSGTLTNFFGLTSSEMDIPGGFLKMLLAFELVPLDFDKKSEFWKRLLAPFFVILLDFPSNIY